MKNWLECYHLPRAVLFRALNEKSCSGRRVKDSVYIGKTLASPSPGPPCFQSNHTPRVSLSSPTPGSPCHAPSPRARANSVIYYLPVCRGWLAMEGNPLTRDNTTFLHGNSCMSQAPSAELSIFHSQRKWLVFCVRVFSLLVRHATLLSLNGECVTQRIIKEKHLRADDTTGGFFLYYPCKTKKRTVQPTQTTLMTANKNVLNLSEFGHKVTNKDWLKNKWCCCNEMCHYLNELNFSIRQIASDATKCSACKDIVHRNSQTLLFFLISGQDLRSEFFSVAIKIHVVAKRIAGKHLQKLPVFLSLYTKLHRLNYQIPLLPL